MSVFTICLRHLEVSVYKMSLNYKRCTNIETLIKYIYVIFSTDSNVFIAGLAVSGIASDVLHGCICHFTFIRVTNSGLGKSHL